jgi:hydrophobe/amphiphile efflux-1 (HAE1) family protein
MAEFSKFFVDRPIFAGVISVLVVLIGLLAVMGLPIAQYPEIAPPTIQVNCTYPGASSVVVAETVAAPIEQQIVGVENMLYMSSQSANDGTYALSVTFKLGTNLDDAQVQVQNRVNLAMPILPETVRQMGVVVKKKSAAILLVLNVYSPDQSRDQLYLSNFTTINLLDELKQIPGVGDVTMFGQKDYAMRIWLDPDKVAARGLTATEIVAALREQNVQVAAGAIGRPPVPSGQAFQFTLSALGRLTDVSQFSDIIIRTSDDGRVTRLRDVVSSQRMAPDGDGTIRQLGGIELGGRSEDTACRLDGQPSIGLAFFQQPGSNALTTAELIRGQLTQLREKFPPGVEAKIVYDTTPFIEESVAEVFKSLRDAIVLVGLVVLLFLQSWRATLIPLIAVPVAIIGTFSVMSGMGFSLNNLSLLGLVLAIGIVVDDAIVVVEAVEHKLEHGLSPREATRAAMDEVASPILAISLVLMAVFIPCAFIAGITGEFFKQFAITVAVATFFSALNSLTLSPALCALLLRRKEEQRDPLTRLLNGTLGWFFALFNRVFEKVTGVYANTVTRLMQLAVVVLVVYAGLLYGTYESFRRVPTGFVPEQDKGSLIVNIQLPDAASLERTKQVVAEVEKIALGDPENKEQYPGIEGVAHVISIPGFSMVQNSGGSSFASMFVVLDEFHDRHGEELHAPKIAARLRRACFQQVQDGIVAVFGPPAIDGLGAAGGFKVMIRDRADYGIAELQRTAEEFVMQASSKSELTGLYSPLRSNTPQLFIDIDRTRCKSMGLSLSDVFLTLQVYMGGLYTNDFNQFGRTWQVTLQADPSRRLAADDVKKLQVRNQEGNMVPLGSVAEISPIGGPDIVTRYNGAVAAAINGAGAPGVSSGEVISTVQNLAKRVLPNGFDYQWTELTLMQVLSGNTAILVFALAVLLVYLLLAAQYEDLLLPLAVILVVPLCILCAVLGVAYANMDINIFVQIGFVVLAGLASKNAILIVEFAKEEKAKGESAFQAAVIACRQRLRPIIMTSLAFIMGVVPLVLAEGAGAELRQTLGVAVFSGMLGVTVFGIFMTPVFYYVLEAVRAAMSKRLPESKPAELSNAEHAKSSHA